jgi:AraC-like DNA-binding protein
MTTVSPNPALADVVRSFTIVETDTETTRVLLPEMGAVLGIRYEGSAALIEGVRTTVLPDVTLTGMRNSVRRMCTSAGGGIVVVSFREDGARAVFDVPVRELFNGITGLDRWVVGEVIEDLQQTVVSAKDSASRIRSVEQFLLARKSHKHRDAAVTAAARAMRSTRGAISIRSLAAGLGLSLDRFEKRFRLAVGASPKQYCSILRVRQALGCYRANMNLAELASEAGYYDQSHFIREFRAVTGETPQRFLRNADYC